MKIATYNIWNSSDGMPYREEHISEEIKNTDAEIICLQEVQNSELAERIATATHYGFCCFHSFCGESEGLAILSRLPFTETASLFGNANAIICTVEVNGKRLCVVNLHLPWDSELNREEQIVKIVSTLDGMKTDYAVLAGDFNCSETSDTNRFLLGECLLDGKEVTRNWYDLATAYAQQKGVAPECTLDFTKNPRFVGNTIETNSRVDRIMLRNTYPADFPVLKSCRVFGQKVYDKTKLAASDHYGILAEMDF